MKLFDRIYYIQSPGFSRFEIDNPRTISPLVCHNLRRSEDKSNPNQPMLPGTGEKPFPEFFPV
ncbi:MAG: hypothetical protein A2Z16_16850 [Chloroflexi bacterium RBG_16_54_18]|nr:MAG: hypothetical protein A2Z16_16850 [Chloroflexi bacterium RBG_16_54_18]